MRPRPQRVSSALYDEAGVAPPPLAQSHSAHSLGVRQSGASPGSPAKVPPLLAAKSHSSCSIGGRPSNASAASRTSRTSTGSGGEQSPTPALPRRRSHLVDVLPTLPATPRGGGDAPLPTLPSGRMASDNAESYEPKLLGYEPKLLGYESKLLGAAARANGELGRSASMQSRRSSRLHGVASLDEDVSADSTAMGA